MAEVVVGGVSTVHFFHADQVGTTRAVTDANGNNLASCAQNATYPNGSFLTYSPFGTPMDCTQSATAYKFTSKEQDAESSLDHFRYRKYSALQARWLTPDPAGLGAACEKNPQWFHLYQYALNGPAQNKDINGLFLPACSPEGFDVELDSIDLPPCPWLLILIPSYSTVTVPCKAVAHVRTDSHCIYGLVCGSGFVIGGGYVEATLSFFEAKCLKTVTTCPPNNALTIEAKVELIFGLPIAIGPTSIVGVNCALVH